MAAVERQEREQVDHREREADQGEHEERLAGVELDRLPGHLVAADDARRSACAARRRRSGRRSLTVCEVTSHIRSSAQPAAPAAPRVERLRAVGEAEASGRSAAASYTGRHVDGDLARRRASTVDLRRGLGAGSRRPASPAHSCAGDLLTAAALEVAALRRRPRPAGRRARGSPRPACPSHARRPSLVGSSSAEGEEEEDHERDHEVHERARGDHHDPLPDRLVA